MSTSSKAAKLVPQAVRPTLTPEEIQAIKDSIGPIDAVEMARTRAEWANGGLAPGGTSPREVVALLRARRVGERGPGRVPAKALFSLRIRPAVLEAWKATGAGWQGRLEEYIAAAPCVRETKAV